MTRRTIEDRMREVLEDVMAERGMLDTRLINLPYQERARVRVMMDKDGDIVLRPQAERWLNRNIKGDWGVAGYHNMVDSDCAEAVFGFATEQDRTAFLKKWPLL